MKTLKVLFCALALVCSAAFVAGCEDSDTVTHKITFHNKSSYTVTQNSSIGTITIPAGDKKAYGNDSMTIGSYSPSSRVTRTIENSHTVVYYNR